MKRKIVKDRDEKAALQMRHPQLLSFGLFILPVAQLLEAFGQLLAGFWLCPVHLCFSFLCSLRSYWALHSTAAHHSVFLTLPATPMANPLVILPLVDRGGTSDPLQKIQRK